MARLALPRDVYAAEYECHADYVVPVKFLSEEEEEGDGGEEGGKRVEVDYQTEVQVSQSGIVDGGRVEHELDKVDEGPPKDPKEVEEVEP